ncbi:MAG TPA: hypothetical protein VEH10_05755 [Thermoplasmata archaeon]|nr:hypothetical protein [Thermoplasmata archaeon]
MFASRAVKWGTVALLLAVVSSFAYAGVSAAHGSGGSRQGATGPTYNVTFTETGLAAGTNWSVFVHGEGDWSSGSHAYQTSSNASITFSLPNGTYRYHVRDVRGYDLTNGSRGTFNVSGGSPAPISVTFSVPTTYTVTFTEHGLPAGTNWTVRLHPEGGFGRDFRADFGRGWGDHGSLEGSSNGTTITFSLPNGTFRYFAHAAGFFAVNGSRGTVTVNGSSPATVDVNFSSPTSPTLYNVTFAETGLPAGTNWSVIVAGGGGFHHHGHHHGAETTSNSTLTLALGNGSYRYDVLRVPGYGIADNGSRGTFNVSGASPATISIVFVKLVTYTVTFTESGLPNGTNWTVVVGSWGGWGSSGGTTQVETSNGTTITFSLTNGTYWFFVGHVHGYRATNNSTGSLNVSGASPPTVDVTFAASHWGDAPVAAAVPAQTDR